MRPEQAAQTVATCEADVVQLLDDPIADVSGLALQALSAAAPGGASEAKDAQQPMETGWSLMIN